MNQLRTEEKKESKWDTIDWSKRTSENEKTEDNKYENIKDKSMNGEEFKEDLENFNEKEVDHNFIQESNNESDDKDDDFGWLKDYEENSEDDELDDLSWLKDYDEKSEINKIDDLNKDFMEGIEVNLDHQDIDKDFKERLQEKNQDYENSGKNSKEQLRPSQKIRYNENHEKVEIKSFPNITRQMISEKIYKSLMENTNNTNSDIVKSLLKDFKGNSEQNEWLNKLPKDELKEIHKKLEENNSKFEESLSKYLHDLTDLVKDIKNLNDTNQRINFSELSRDLINGGRNLNLKRAQLDKTISEIYNHFRNTFDKGFNLERLKRETRPGTESEKESIRCLKKENRLLHEMYDGQFEGRCANPNCNTDFKRLPSFEFHHKDSSIKSLTWNDLMHEDYSKIKEELENQQAIPICRNCHSIENSKIYNDFEHIITKKDLFNYTSIEINKMITKEVEHFINHNKTSYTVLLLKYEVDRWIKKRAVIEQIFDGKCVVCGENRLPALETHHTNPEIKEHKWSKISKRWDIKELANDFIIKEEVVFVCGNCHVMENSKNFENNVKEILGEKYLRDVKKDYNNIHSIIDKQTERIKDIKNGNIKLAIRDYLNEK